MAETENREALELTEVLRVRREKLAGLIEKGENPYELTVFDQQAHSEEIKSDFEKYDGKEISIAGRMMSKRVMGKASFAHIRDGQGLIQIYARRDVLGEEEYAAFKQMDIGDILGVSGTVFKTNAGEVSVKAEKITLLSKSLQVLPEKFHGLKDMDMRYRQRYVDLIVNPEVKDTFIKRSAILKEIRDYLDSRGFLEVDTPVLHTLEIGAAARPFVTHHNTLDIDMYLRIETELYLKRLIVGGFEKVYEVGRIFRNEGMDIKHNPEFTSVELYQAYTDYFGMMDLIEDMYITITRKVCGGDIINYQGTEINMGSPWKRMTMAEAVKEYSGADYYSWADAQEARECAARLGVEVNSDMQKGDVLSALFDEFVEDKLIQPTIIYDYPVEISPLAKRKKDAPDFTERFEYFIYAREMGNAFSELNDPIDQRGRFEKQVAAKRALGENAEVDEDFITALEYGMPPTGGLGFGVDRLVMLLTDNYSIRDVLLFPTMKPLDK